MDDKSLKGEAIRGLKWTAIERFVIQGIQFVISLCMARLLVPADYGIVGMTGIFMTLSYTFVDSGFGAALIRKKDVTETDFSTVFYFNLAVALLLYLLLFATAPYIAIFFKTRQLCAVLRVQAICLVFSSLIQIQNAKLTIALDFKALSTRSMLTSIVSGIAGVLMAYLGLGVWALVFQSLIASFLNIIILNLYVKWKPSLTFSKKSFKDLGSFGSKLLASGILHTFYNQMNTLVIGKFYTKEDLGYYNRGTQFAALPIDTMNSVLQKVTYPVLSKIQDDDEKLIHVYRKYICLVSIPIFFGCAILASLAKPMILLLLTEKWADSIIYLQIFAFAIMFDHICTINLNLLKVKGRSDLFLRLEIIKKAIAFIILIAAIRFGVIGICVSKIIYTQIAVFINTYYTGKLFGLGYWTQIKDFGIYFLAAVAACLPSYILSLCNLSNILTLVIGIVLSVAIYFIILRKNDCFKELIELTKQTINREK